MLYPTIDSARALFAIGSVHRFTGPDSPYIRLDIQTPLGLLLSRSDELTRRPPIGLSSHVILFFVIPFPHDVMTPFLFSHEP